MSPALRDSELATHREIQLGRPESGQNVSFKLRHLADRLTFARGVRHGKLTLVRQHVSMMQRWH